MVINQKNMNNSVHLLEEIENLKKLLLEYGTRNGLNDPITLKISEKLDTYIVIYQKLMIK
ncbi:aspartyl-phosphate phosphatase Spo0E family protein [Bacillus sp. B1-b2]|uniref:aspartyl-phosphate phosphatase Spo0E family protein n=1 Tax=Bacillus sp. B1-b2 TaxID=2653201 RepID=UPI0012614385|nr:aspartyl-phosphate phosphatase Spo0E family protein [Bacillus sp. B1-b2]KAB7671800.1 aspartyl-phosphate phosphatase Spo0E family protein [Bacillus sp. B1-b2]